MNNITDSKTYPYYVNFNCPVPGKIVTYTSATIHFSAHGVVEARQKVAEVVKFYYTALDAQLWGVGLFSESPLTGNIERISLEQEPATQVMQEAEEKAIAEIDSKPAIKTKFSTVPRSGVCTCSHCVSWRDLNSKLEIQFKQSYLFLLPQLTNKNSYQLTNAANISISADITIAYLPLDVCELLIKHLDLYLAFNLSDDLKQYAGTKRQKLISHSVKFRLEGDL